jgi:hypothetical protein
MPEDRSSIYVQLIMSMGGNAYGTQDGVQHAEASAGRDAAPALAALRAVSDKAVREIAYVLPPMPGHTAGVRLGDELYVRRRIDSAVLRDVRARLSAVASRSGERPKAAAIVGDPGYGKSCLLWWLHRKLGADAEVFLVPATALTAREPAGLSLARLLAGLEEAASSGPAVLLLDTADVLLHR